MWVRSEHAGALAVLAAWAGALIPWSVSLASAGGATLVVIRFLFVRVQYVFGLSLGELERPVVSVLAIRGYAESGPLVRAYTLWLVAAGVFALAILLSVAYYFGEERVEAAPVDPVRAMGVILVLSALPLTWSTWVLVRRYPGLTIPVGVLFLYLFGGVLLAVDRA